VFIVVSLYFIIDSVQKLLDIPYHSFLYTELSQVIENVFIIRP